MLPEYAAWIRTNVTNNPDMPHGTGYGRCKEVATAMVAAFPELRLVKGFYHCPIIGERCHWWCLTGLDEIVDPTAAQFPSAALVSQGAPEGVAECYEGLSDVELETRAPVGRCANCGNTIYGKVNSGRATCGERCDADYAAYLMQGVQ